MLALEERRHKLAKNKSISTATVVKQKASFKKRNEDVV